jgi:SAM-dependent methyltransferase
MAREMMIGLRHPFEYVECGSCGALQIGEIPDDLTPYYDGGYYAYAPPQRASPFKRRLKARLARHVLDGPDPIGAVLVRIRGVPPEIEWVRTAGLELDARILDVGAGSGQLLVSLHEYGFRRVLGADPFVPRSLDHGDGVRVLRAPLTAVEGEFDLIMFHHSFEHVPNPTATLGAARDRLAEGGVVLLRMPVASESWRVYGPDWVELDAPRHLHVHTLASVGLLAEAAGLQVDTVRFDTDGFELWGSEQYRRDIPLHDPRSHASGGRGEVFESREMREFAERARELNRTGRAGRAGFWLRRS